MKRVVIVGAGISGLTLAYRLQLAAPATEIVVLENQCRPGGTMWTERLSGFQVEIGPNGFLDNIPSTKDLCRDLGLGDKLIPASAAAGRKRYLFWNDRLCLLPGSLPAFLVSDLLSWRGKGRLFLERFIAGRRGHVDESIDAFVRRRAGSEVAEVLADALVTGIYAGDAGLLSVGAAFPRLAAMEKEFGSVLKGMRRSAHCRRAEAAVRGEKYQGRSQMWSFREGLRLLIETIRDRLNTPPVLGVNVRRLEPQQRNPPGTTWSIRAEGNENWTADAVVLTCPAYRQAAIVSDMDHELAGRIEGIAYNRVAVVALGYRQVDVPGGLDGFGFIAPQRTRRDVLGVQWCSSIFPGRAPADAVLLRAMCGGWNRPEVAGWDDARLLDAVRSELRLAQGISAEPLFHHIVRWDRAIPQYHLGHLERVDWIEQRTASYPGLFLGGNAYHGVALNDCTAQAERLAARVAQYLHEPAH